MVYCAVGYGLHGWKHAKLAVSSYNKTLSLKRGYLTLEGTRKVCFSFVFSFWFIHSFFVRLAIFGQTRQSVILFAIEVLKLECVGRAVILQAQPIADKEKSHWNRSLTRLGSRPSAASVETSITPVLNSGGRHWLQDRENKCHWLGEFYNLCAGGETEWEETVSRRSLCRPPCC